MQETEKPGVRVAQICRRHAIATSMGFRWRVEFGLTARKALQLATVELADGAANEPPALAALHLALGHTDTRKGLDGLATLIQEHLKKDPLSSHLFVFRGKNASLLKILF